LIELAYRSPSFMQPRSRGILGALGSCGSFVATLTIIPFIPNAWAASAGGFPAMTKTAAFLLKDLVLLAASFYLLRQDAVRVAKAVRPGKRAMETGRAA
jgi:uncharacterized membrane protein YkgB